jgi:predicted DNA binding CopG/RHH family protein
MSKTVSIGKRPSARPSVEAVDKWMESQASKAEETAGQVAPPATSTDPKADAPKMKRLTIDIPDSLHRRVKSRCGQDGLRMADVIRNLLEERFPAQS